MYAPSPIKSQLVHTLLMHEVGEVGETGETDRADFGSTFGRRLPVQAEEPVG